jgi:transposase-like protein
MSSTRRKYTAEFKESSIKLVTEKGYSITEAARNGYYAWLSSKKSMR